MIPLFPLGTVLFPGAPLPLRIFEDRYRVLMADLLAGPEPERRFGVVAIRRGREVGVNAVEALHDVGCVAVITDLRQAADGTYGIETVGSTRFRILSVDDERPYLRAAVEWLPEPVGEVDGLDQVVRHRYATYRAALGTVRGLQAPLPDLPGDDRLLSYLVAATVIADAPDRQRFLAEYDAAARLGALAEWLARETMLLTTLSAVPAGRLLEVPPSPN